MGVGREKGRLPEKQNGGKWREEEGGEILKEFWEWNNIMKH